MRRFLASTPALAVAVVVLIAVMTWAVVSNAHRKSTTKIVRPRVTVVVPRSPSEKHDSGPANQGARSTQHTKPPRRRAKTGLRQAPHPPTGSAPPVPRAHRAPVKTRAAPRRKVKRPTAARPTQPPPSPPSSSPPPPQPPPPITVTVPAPIGVCTPLARINTCS